MITTHVKKHLRKTKRKISRVKSHKRRCNYSWAPFKEVKMKPDIRTRLYDYQRDPQLQAKLQRREKFGKQSDNFSSRVYVQTTPEGRFEGAIGYGRAGEFSKKPRKDVFNELGIERL